MKIYSTQTSLAFGHNLDYKLAAAKKKWNNTCDKTLEYKKELENENTDFNNKDKLLDSQIQIAQDEEQRGLEWVRKRQNALNRTKSFIEESSKLSDEINLNSQQIQEANKKHKLSVQAFQELKEKQDSIYNAEYDSIANSSIKAQLVKKLINPINTRFDDNPPRIASNVFISDELAQNTPNEHRNYLYEQILLSVAKMTNSNYGIINAFDYNNKPLNTFFQDLKTILSASDKLHESNGSHSITLLSNLHYITPQFSPKDINFFVEMADKSSELFHNSFIIITALSKEIKKGLSLKLKIDAGITSRQSYLSMMANQSVTKNKMEELFSPKAVLDCLALCDTKFGIEGLGSIEKNKKILGKDLKQFLK